MSEPTQIKNVSYMKPWLTSKTARHEFSMRVLNSGPTLSSFPQPIHIPPLTADAMRYSTNTAETVALHLWSSLSSHFREVATGIVNLFPSLSKTDYSLVVAGGAFRSVYMNTPISDLDIYIVGPELDFVTLNKEFANNQDYFSWQSSVVADRRPRSSISGKVVVGMVMPCQKHTQLMATRFLRGSLSQDTLEIQFKELTAAQLEIATPALEQSRYWKLSKVPSNLEEIISGFDVVPSMCGMSLDSTGTRVEQTYAHPAWEWSCSKKILMPNPGYSGPYDFGRLLKYSLDYGFSIPKNIRTQFRPIYHNGYSPDDSTTAEEMMPVHEDHSAEVGEDADDIAF